MLCQPQKVDLGTATRPRSLVWTRARACASVVFNCITYRGSCNSPAVRHGVPHHLGFETESPTSWECARAQADCMGVAHLSWSPRGSVLCESTSGPSQCQVCLQGPSRGNRHIAFSLAWHLLPFLSSGKWTVFSAILLGFPSESLPAAPFTGGATLVAEGSAGWSG